MLELTFYKRVLFAGPASQAAVRAAVRSQDYARTPVFQQRWFLDAALLRGRYREVRVVENGQELGYLPFGVLRSRNGLQWGGMTDWAHLTGPLVREDLDVETKRRVLRKLVAQLPRSMRLYFACHPSEDTAPLIRDAFVEAGFTHSTVTTYSFPADDPGILSRFSKKHRTHLRAADKHLDVLEVGARAFVRFYEANLTRRGRESYAPLAVAERIIDAGLALDPPQVRVLAARRRPAEGTEASTATRWEAAIACTWDATRYYFWMATRRPDGQEAAMRTHPDAVKLLLVTAGEHAKSLGLIFDLDGSHNEGADNLFRTVLKAPCTEVRDVYRRPRRSHRLLRAVALALRFLVLIGHRPRRPPG